MFFIYLYFLCNVTCIFPNWRRNKPTYLPRPVQAHYDYHSFNCIYFQRVKKLQNNLQIAISHVIKSTILTGWNYLFNYMAQSNYCITEIVNHSFLKNNIEKKDSCKFDLKLFWICLCLMWSKLLHQVLAYIAVYFWFEITCIFCNFSTTRFPLETL